MKIAVVLLHLLFKMLPLFRGLDLSHLFLPFKVAALLAFTMRDMIAPTASANIAFEVAMLTMAAVLTGLLLWPRTVAPSGAGQE